MAISLGTATLSKMYLGVSEITKAYLGATQIFYGTTVDTYAANGISPEFVADFANNYYRVASNDSTFASALTFSRSGNATMVDSDGLIKWAPHNLVTYSGDQTNGAWSKANVSVASSVENIESGIPAYEATISSTGHFLRQTISGLTVGAEYTFAFWAKRGTATDLQLSVQENSAGNFISQNYYAETNSSTYSLITTTFVATVTTMTVCLVRDGGSTGTVFLGGAHVYRSDLGGMVDNPETSNSYVPTTGTARYLSRLGHHVYNGSSYVNEGLLIESEARTNQIFGSDFSYGWSLVRATQTGGQTNNTTGESNAINLIPSADNATHIYINNQGTPNVTLNNVYTLSVYAKANGYNGIRLYGANGVACDSIFDLNTGTVQSEGAGDTASIEDAGNGWYRCSVSYTADATSTDARPYIGIINNSFATTFAGDTTSGILVCQIQHEQASTPSSYIPTSGSTVTRAADSLTSAAANLPYSATAMSIQAEGKAVGDTLTPIRWYADANNYITQEINTSDFSFEQANGGVVDTVTGGTYANDFTIASRHGSTFINGASSGTALTADTTPTALPDLSLSDIDLGQAYMGTIRQVRIWDQDIGDAGIEEATS